MTEKIFFKEKLKINKLGKELSQFRHNANRLEQKIAKLAQQISFLKKKEYIKKWKKENPEKVSAQKKRNYERKKK